MACIWSGPGALEKQDEPVPTHCLANPSHLSPSGQQRLRKESLCFKVKQHILTLEPETFYSSGLPCPLGVKSQAPDLQTDSYGLRLPRTCIRSGPQPPAIKNEEELLKRLTSLLPLPFASKCYQETGGPHNHKCPRCGISGRGAPGLPNP